MHLKALSSLIADAAVKTGVIQKGSLLEGERFGTKRNKIFRTHGFRKFVNTTMINIRLNDTIRNMLLGHSIDLDDNYYKPKEDDLLHEYLKAVDLLTINDEHRLKREVETLKDNKSEIQQLKEEFEKLKAATKHHINNQVKESLELEGVKISEALVDILYKSEKANIRRAVAKYARDNNIEVDFGLSELTD